MSRFIVNPTDQYLDSADGTDTTTHSAQPTLTTSINPKSRPQGDEYNFPAPGTYTRASHTDYYLTTKGVSTIVTENQQGTRVNPGSTWAEVSVDGHGIVSTDGPFKWGSAAPRQSGEKSAVKAGVKVHAVQDASGEFLEVQVPRGGRLHVMYGE